MDRSIEGTLWKHLQENFLPKRSDLRFSPEQDLFDSGVLDSAALLSVIAFLEEEFQIHIPDEDLLPENFSSIRATAAYIQSRVGPDCSQAGAEEVIRGKPG